MINSKVIPPSKLKNLRNNQIVLATHNQGKISEINNLISENIELNKNISEEIRVLSKTIANVNKKQ